MTVAMTAGLLGLFVVFIGVALPRGQEGACGCVGELLPDRQVALGLAVGDAGVIALATTGILPVVVAPDQRIGQRRARPMVSPKRLRRSQDRLGVRAEADDYSQYARGPVGDPEGVCIRMHT